MEKIASGESIARSNNHKISQLSTESSFEDYFTFSNNMLILKIICTGDMGSFPMGAIYYTVKQHHGTMELC